MPTFDPVMILTMSLVMIVVMIESTGMFLALSDITGRKIDQPALAAGLRTDGLGTLIGGIFNTFPYTSFSQNVGLVGVTGVKSRWVCVAGGLIMIVLGLLPKMAALRRIDPAVRARRCGAGDVRHGRGHRHPHPVDVDYKTNRHNLYIVALSIGFGLIPLVAPALDAADGAWPAPAAGVGHPAHRDGRGGAEHVLQRCEGRHGGRDRRREDGRSTLMTAPQSLRSCPQGARSGLGRPGAGP